VSIIKMYDEIINALDDCLFTAGCSDEESLRLAKHIATHGRDHGIRIIKGESDTHEHEYSQEGFEGREIQSDR
jgi:hypothetical protein